MARIVARGLDPLQTLLVCYDAFIGRLLHDPLAQGGHRVSQDEPRLQEARRRWNTCWEATVRDLLARAGEEGILREGIDPGRVSTLVSTALGQFELSLVHPEGPDLWDRMNDVWLSLLPADASDAWVERWRASGWQDRPRPDPEDYRRAREPDTGSESGRRSGAHPRGESQGPSKAVAVAVAAQVSPRAARWLLLRPRRG